MAAPNDIRVDRSGVSPLHLMMDVTTHPAHPPSTTLGSGQPFPDDEPATNTTSIIAVISSPARNARVDTTMIAENLGIAEPTLALWEHRARSLIGAPESPGDPTSARPAEEFRHLLRTLAAEHRHLVVEITPTRGEWTRTAGQMATTVVVVIDADEDHGEIAAWLESASLPGELHLVVDHHRPRCPAGSVDTKRRFGADHLHHRFGRSRRDDRRLARLITGSGTGLVLGGGGARGFAHLGVYRALRELGIDIDIFGGSSIGSPLAAGMADRLEPEQLEERVDHLFDGVLDFTLPVVSFTRARAIARATAKVFGNRTITDLRDSHFSISTDITNARTHLHVEDSVVEAVRASCSIPAVMPPVAVNGRLLVDGGVANNVPIDVMRRFTPRGTVISVNVAPGRAMTSVDSYGLHLSGSAVLRGRVRRTSRYPSMMATVLRSMTVASHARYQEMVRSGMSDLAIDLDLRGVPMFAFDRSPEIARCGYDSAMPILEEWMARTGTST